MRFAIGTTDGVMLCGHFASSAAFIVLDVEDGRIIAKSIRERGSGACGCHKSFLELLEGCQSVLCGGISQSMDDLLSSHGIEPVVSAVQHPVEEAVALYLDGKLKTTTERICICH